MYEAGAALARVASDMGAGQPQLLAQQFHQQRTAFDLDRVPLAVHRQGHLRHAQSLPCRVGRSVVIGVAGGQAGVARAGTISVLAKSAPLKRKGMLSDFASAQEAQSPQLSRA